VHVSSTHIIGRLQVQGGELHLTDCSITAGSERQTGETEGERGLSMVGGRAILVRTAMSGHSAGAIGVRTAQLILIQCTLNDNTAQVGAGMLVGTGSNVTVAHSLFSGNRATISGGAIQVTSCRSNTCAHAMGEQGFVPAGS
jgi:predicted outer membrane repeat protein